jgi:hypothetical protein
MKWVAFPDDSIEVCGLPWFAESSPKLWRFPERFKDRIPEGVFGGGKQTAGVRLRLRTDSEALALKAVFPKFGIRTNMTQFTAHGVSAYVDGRCWSARIPDGEGGEAEMSLYNGVGRRMRDVCLYLPLYGPIEVLSIGVDEAAAFEQPSAFAADGPVVFYGTSITQGGCASRPGLSYQATAARALNIDYANYGFSGMGRCEKEVAEALAEMDASCFVLDVGQNTSVEELDARFQTFLDTICEANPDTLVLATTPIFYNAELWSTGHQAGVEQKREIIRRCVAERRKAGDKRLHILEARDYLWSDFTDGAVDGGHPNDLGFAEMAKGMGKALGKVLGIGD